MPSAVQRSTTRYLFAGVLVLGTMYAWWTLTQYEHLSERNQRELSDAGLELQRTLENAVQTVRLLEPYDADPHHALCDFDREQPYLELVGNCATPVGAADKEATLEHVGVKVQAGGVHIVGTAKGGAQVDFRFRADLILDELAFSDTFGLVVVTDGAGKALDHRGPDGRSWARLLSWPERAWGSTGAGPGNAQDVRDVAALIGSDARPAWAQVSAASTRATVDLGGEWQHLYSHPFATRGAADVDVPLVLVGLAPVRGIVRQALAVDTYFVAVLAIFVLLGTLGFPFVKLMALDGRERFRLRDVHLLNASTAALLVLIVFVVLTVDGYVRFRGAADAGLSALAANVAGNVTREVEAIRDQLASYDATVASGTAIQPPCRSTPKTSVPAAWFTTPSPVLPTAFAPRHLYLEQAAWIDPEGQQVWKITSDPIGHLVGVGQRPYFLAVREGRVFDVDGRGPAFFVAPSRSITDGRFYTFLSIRSRLSDSAACSAASHSGPYVAVATARLRSVERQPLPAGYGFAIVDREGRVLYHSDARLSLRQNLFRELGNGRDVRAMIYSGYAGFASSGYQERPTRLFLRPLVPMRGPALYVVAFRDLSLERAVAARAFVTSLAGPLPLLVVVICGALHVGNFASRRVLGGAGRWLWPHGGLNGMYRQLTATFLVVVLVGAIGLAFEWWPLVIVALPVLAAGGGIVVVYRVTPHQGPRTRLVTQRWLLAEFTLLAVCMVIVPSAAIFSLTLGHEFGTLVATERDWMTHQRTSAPAAFTAEARADRQSDGVAERSIESWTQRVVDMPAPFDQEVRAVVPADPPANDAAPDGERHHGAVGSLVHVHTWIDRALPIESDIASRQRYRPEDDASYTPHGWLGLPLGWVSALGIAAALGALLWWFRWNARRLFLIDVDVPCPAPVQPTEDPDAAWRALSDEHQHLLMQVAQEQIANPYQRESTLELLRRGLLTLCPELRPATPAWEAFVLAKAREGALEQRLRASEDVGATHSWGYVRTVLLGALIVVSLFLLATQPGLQSDLIGIGTGASALATAGLKVREAIRGFFDKGGRTA